MEPANSTFSHPCQSGELNTLRETKKLFCQHIRNKMILTYTRQLSHNMNEVPFSLVSGLMIL